MIQLIKRHRKQRHTRLRELTRDLDDDTTSSGTTSRDSFFRRLAAGEIQCPVCMGSIRGDDDVVEAHIDACLAHQARLAEERGDMDTMEGPGHVGDVTGMRNYGLSQAKLILSGGRHRLPYAKPRGTGCRR